MLKLTAEEEDVQVPVYPAGIAEAFILADNPQPEISVPALAVAPEPLNVTLT